ncbi:MAG: hypothetical protein HS127_01370 [Planctomycetia bacterium]|nr:hypothetical protein [Planctomycetia bacterium]
MIEEAKLKYIPALDRNQIPSCGVSLKSLNGLSIEDKDASDIPIPQGF